MTTLQAAASGASVSWFARVAGRRQARLWSALGYVVLIGVGVLLVMPLLWMILSSLKSPERVLSLTWLPEQVVFANYADIVQRGFLYNFGVSVVISVLAGLGSVVSSSLVGFGFARLRFVGRDVLFTMVLATMMLSTAVTLVPTFILFQRAGWYDTLLPLIVPSWFGAAAYGGGALYIFLMRQFYLTLPLELDEAARIDGAGVLGVYWYIILPLSLPALGVVAAFAFIANWNDFLLPLIFVQRQALWPLALAVRALMGEFQHGNPWGSLMAASVLMVAPVGLVLFVSQRAFVRGIATTGLAGR
jgi:ABC-type glycerol-3-phosphate transport system permease component